MNNLQVEYFLAVCKYMSFTEASRILYVSQPAVSKQISALEREIGMPLFDRTYRNLHLTPAGELIRDAFTRIKHIYEEALDEAKQFNTKNRGTLSIGVPGGWIISRLFPPPDLMGKVKADYPEVSFRILHLGQEELYQRLIHNELDMVFIHRPVGELEHGKFASIVVTRVGLRLFYAASRVPKGESLTLEDLKGEPFYTCPELERIGLADQLRSHCEGVGFSPNIVPAPNIESVISSVEIGTGGVGVFDELYKLSESPRFRYIDLPIHIELCLVWRKESRSPLATHLINEFRLLMG